MDLTKLKNTIKHLIYYFGVYLLPKRKNNFSNETGISTLMGHQHAKMFIYAASSFFYQINNSLPIHIINDGTLTKHDKFLLNKKFTVKISSIKNCDKKMKKVAVGYANFNKYRFNKYSPVTKYKFDTILLSPFKRTIYLEPDLLFFKFPTELEKWLQRETDCFYHLAHNREYLKAWKKADLDYSFRFILNKNVYQMASLGFNSGILTIPNKEQIDLNYLNEIFEYFNKVNYSINFTAEETAIACLFNKINKKELPSTKYIAAIEMEEYENIKISQTIALHYIFKLKTQFKIDAAKLAIKTLFFHK